MYLFLVSPFKLYELNNDDMYICIETKLEMGIYRNIFSWFLLQLMYKN